MPDTIIVAGTGKSQHLFPPESWFEELVASILELPEQALESATLVFKTERDPETSNPHSVSAVEERRVTLDPVPCPSKMILTKVEVAFAANRSLVFAVTASRVLDAETAAEKMMLGSVWALLPELFVISRPLNAEGLVMVPERVCWEEPLKVVVPEL